MRNTPRTTKIWHYMVENDGFDLGATRRPIDKNDPPDALKKWKIWKEKGIITDEWFGIVLSQKKYWVVDVETIIK